MMGLALLSGAGLTGCQAHLAASAEQGEQSAEEKAADAEVASEVRDYHRHHTHGGVIQFVVMSLDTLGVAEARKAQVVQVQRDLRTCLAPAGEIESKLLQNLADGVAAGAVSRAKIDEALVQLNASAISLRECKPDALNQLHGILSSAERESLVDKVEAHFDVWREVNEDKPRGPGHQVEQLTREVSLTPSQVAAINSALDAAHPEANDTYDGKHAEAYFKAFEEAFPKEQFDARSITLDANGPLVGHGVRHMARFYEVVTPLLTPEQRTTLSTHLREHANHQSAVSAN
jgi:Spy/CpxP family protein refolding chaperone